MSIARSQMNRQLYNMGGEGIMQVAPQMDPQQAQGEQYRPQAEALAQDPKKAIAIIIQMLVAQGIPLEEAKKIAMQMIQGVAEGGMEEVEDDQRVEARFGGRIGYANGGIGSLVNREQYGFGSVFKSVGKAVSGVVKGVTNAVKSVAKSPIGKIALTVAAAYALGPAGLNVGAGMGSFAGGALRAGLANLAVQAASGQPINFKEALIAGGIGGVTSGLTQGTTGTDGFAADPNQATLADVGLGDPTLPSTPVTTAAAPTEMAFDSSLYDPTDVGGGAVGIENITGNYGQSTGLRFDNPALAGYQDVAGGSPMNILGPGGRLEAIQSNLGQGNYLDALKQVSGAALDYPMTSIAGASTLAGLSAAQPPEQQPGESDEAYQARVAEWKQTFAQNLQTGPTLGTGARNPFYAAYGGRAKFGFGSMLPQLMSQTEVAQPVSSSAGSPASYNIGGGGGFGGLIRQLTQQTFFGKELGNPTVSAVQAANGGRIGYAFGSVDQGIMAAPQIAQGMGMPVGNPRQNQQGVSELDYRDQGGFVPPIGVKERADDIPAMLSNNEFVFTADAVKNAGGGDPNVGAQKMYALMKRLEHGGLA